MNIHIKLKSRTHRIESKKQMGSSFVVIVQYLKFQIVNILDQVLLLLYNTLNFKLPTF